MRHGILLSRRWRSCKSKKVAFNPFVWRYCGWKNNNEHGPVDPPVVPSSSYISLLQLACHTHVLLPLKIAWSLKNKIEIENGGSRKKQTEITQRRYSCPNGWNMGHTLASAFQRRVVKRSESFLQFRNAEGLCGIWALKNVLTLRCRRSKQKKTLSQ